MKESLISYLVACIQLCIQIASAKNFKNKPGQLNMTCADLSTNAAELLPADQCGTKMVTLLFKTRLIVIINEKCWLLIRSSAR